jgi:adenylate kinase
MLAGKLKITPVASGDLFRQALEKETELGKKARAFMDKGRLVPDEITIRMVLERLAAPDTKKGAVLDGFPRNIKQAGALDEDLARQGKAVAKAIYIEVPEAELLRRMAGRLVCRDCQAPYHETDSPPKKKGACDRCGGELYQRADDNAATIKKRLEVYFTETAPLIDYYKKAGKLLEIDGEGGTAAVNRRILAALK